MTITVPLVLIGDAKGVKEGGLLSQSINQLEINCFPTDVPEQIELNVEDLGLNSSMNISDINLDNDDIEIITDKEVNVVNISQLVEEEVEEEVEETSDDSTTGEEIESSTEGSAE
jgi:large subunit ribosomal protein L25